MRPSSGKSSSKSRSPPSSKSPRSSNSKKSPRTSSSKSPNSSKSKSTPPSKQQRYRSVAATAGTRKSKKPKRSKAKSSSSTSSSLKSSLKSQETLPFTPSRKSYSNDLAFYGSDNSEEEAVPAVEDYFNDFSPNFDEHPPPPPLEYTDPPPETLPPPPFPFGDGDDTQNPPELITVIDTSELPSIYPTNIYTNNSSEGCVGSQCPCCWWKARSILCYKCLEIPLYPRQKPQSGGYGYGFIRKFNPNRPGINGEGDHSIFGKLIPGLCSECAAKEAAEAACAQICWGGDFGFRSERKRGQLPRSSNKNAKCSNNSKNLCNCTTSTEYKSAYTNPENQQNIKHRHKTGQSLKEQRNRDQVYLAKFRELMRRPPWNFDTRVPTPPFDESLGGVETKLQNLDEMVTERHTPKRVKSRRNFKPYKTKSRPRKNISKSRSRARSRKYPTKRPTSSPSRARQPRKYTPPPSKKSKPKKKAGPPVSSTTDDDDDDDDLDSGEGESDSGSYTDDTLEQHGIH